MGYGRLDRLGATQPAKVVPERTLAVARVQRLDFRTLLGGMSITEQFVVVFAGGDS